MTAADAAISIVLTDREGRMDLCIVLMIGRCESFIHGSQPCEGGTGKEVEEHITAACQERKHRWPKRTYCHRSQKGSSECERGNIGGCR